MEAYHRGYLSVFITSRRLKEAFFLNFSVETSLHSFTQNFIPSGVEFWKILSQPLHSFEFLWFQWVSALRWYVSQCIIIIVFLWTCNRSINCPEMRSFLSIRLSPLVNVFTDSGHYYPTNHRLSANLWATKVSHSCIIDLMPTLKDWCKVPWKLLFSIHFK